MTGPATEPAAKLNVLVPLIIGGSMMIQTLNSTVLVTALPTLALAFDHSPVDLNVTITYYLLSIAVFLPVSGWMADRFGSRSVFRAAIAIYLLSSICCGISQSLEQLIAARVLGGAAAAMMTPVGRLILVRSAPKHELVRAMAYVTIPSLIGPVLGPPLGGFIVTYWSWRWIFFINVPIGLVAIILVSLYIPALSGGPLRKLDIRGALLSGTGLAALIFGLQNLGNGNIETSIALAITATGSLLLIGYLLHSRNVESPILNFSLLRVPTFVAGMVGGLFARMLNGAMPFLLALLLQVGFGMTAFASGLLTFASALAALLMKTAAAPVLRRLGFRNVLIWNSILVAVTFSSYAFFTTKTPYVVIVALLFVGGFFRSLQFTALNTIAYADTSPSGTSNASTLIAMSQPLSQSIGIALSAALVQFLAWQQGGHVDAAAISPVFVILGICSLVSLLFFTPLPRSAGSDVSGHHGH